MLPDNREEVAYIHMKRNISELTELLDEWNFEKNGSLNPDHITYGSKKSVWWKGRNCGHEWKASPNNRKGGLVGCSICRYIKTSVSLRNTLLYKTGSIAETHTDLLQEWNYKKNVDISPEQFTYGSKQKIWWICKYCKNEWVSTIQHRTSKDHPRGCPNCAKHSRAESYKKAMVNKNGALQFTHPELLMEWDYEENRHLSPTEVAPGSTEIVSWVCNTPYRHKWKMSIRYRAQKGQNCPYCSRRRISPERSLAAVNPQLAAEWHPTKNGELTPWNIFPNSTKIVWWKGFFCSHEWDSAIHWRNKGNGCPICAKEFGTSFPEQAIYYYVQKMLPNTINKYIVEYKGNHYEYDIYIPDCRLLIEYDGAAFHYKKKKHDELKNKIASEHLHLKLIRIRESDRHISLPKLDPYNSISMQAESRNDKSLEQCIDEISNYIRTLVDIPQVSVNIERDRSSILSLYITSVKPDNLLERCPNIAEEWDYEKNSGLKPDQFYYRSKKIFAWKCKECQNQWKCAIHKRTTRGSNCPKCKQFKRN